MSPTVSAARPVRAGRTAVYRRAVDPTADLTSLAPEPASRWGAGVARLVDEVPADRLSQLADVVQTRLRADPADVPIPAGGRATPDDPVTAFAEQFVVDVSRVTPDQRATAFTALGADAFPTVQALYVVDLGTRMNAAFRALFDATVPVTAASGDLWSTLEEFMRAVARLRALDPTTTEVVRLRGARAHDCRLCRSLRNVHAVRAGGDETFFDQIDDFERSALDARRKVALRLVDAMIWQPAAWPEGLAGELHDHWSPAELAELVLDVVRNAANKIAVAFGADEPHVTEGLEYYDTDPAGDPVYGLTL
jgi:hypothetical protein